MELTPGQEYRRRDLHEAFGGQQQGGISTPVDSDVILLFTGATGEQYGYRDEFKNGVFEYTGEGQRGDMEMVRGNLAIRDHEENGKQLLVFEQTRKGHVRFMGEARYIDDFRRPQPDLDGRPREAIVFQLEVDRSEKGNPANQLTRSREVPPPSLRKRSLKHLRRLALEQSKPGSDGKERKRIVRRRSQAIKAYVLKRSGGRCEGCEVVAPFEALNGGPYLEPHHIRSLGDGGPDDPLWVVALCPNCHAHVHYGIDGDSFNARLAERVGQIESDLGDSH